MGRLVGKVAIITGAARGQGQAEAERFVAEGARVVLTDLLPEVHDVASALGDAARSVTHDVSDEAAWNTVIDVAREAFGGVDILVNNAGIYRVGRLLETTTEEFRRILDVNLFGVWNGIRAAAPLMIERRSGSIINIASVAGIRATPNASLYTASKFAVRGITKAAALELGPQGVRVNAILPGVIPTPMIERHITGREELIASTIPLRTLGMPADIADLAVYLASDESRFVTGADHVIDGGMSL
jgi:3alpha(or 20beta)-hydroxysteroid dehydrogenase